MRLSGTGRGVFSNHHVERLPKQNPPVICRCATRRRAGKTFEDKLIVSEVDSLIGGSFAKTKTTADKINTDDNKGPFGEKQ